MWSAAVDGHGPLEATLLLVVQQHPLLPLDALTEHLLKRGVTLAFRDVPSDRRANHVRDRLAVDRRDRVQLL